MIRVGLVGYGLAGASFHAPLIRACSRMHLSGILTSRDAPGAVRDLGTLLDRSDLIVVASPNSTHFEIAKTALEAGKHVVVDKPFTVTVAEADELIATAESRGQLLSVFHNRRWDGDFLTVQRLLPQLGAVMLYQAHWDRFRPALREGWKEQPGDSTGVLIDLGPHLIDQVLQLFGDPDAMTADIGAQRQAGLIDDYFELTLHYGAMRAVLGCSTLVADARPRFAIHSNAGSFVKYGFDPQEQALKNGVDPRAEGFAVDLSDGVLTTPDGTRHTITTEPGRYLAFYEAVARAITEGGPNTVDPRDAREVMKLIELARESARTGRRMNFKRGE